MKVRLVLLLFSLSLLWGCSKKTESESTKSFAFSGEQIDSVRRENLKAKVDNNIILGFRFGMSKQDYDYNFSRLVANKTLFRYSKADYALEIKSDSLPGSVDALFIPLFDQNKLVALKLLAHGTTSATPAGSLILSKYLTKHFGQEYMSTRSVSDVWIKGGVEVEVRRQKVQADPNLSPLVYDVVMFRPTQLALLSHL
ncbi:hypothetical protein EXU85_20245 [Spirosoma sp. KCTC 42546]|uniref:hypothetical protein n=1 Tax=Spirosoma sp. KCTC 42546 TaxID=2520506 RepID=UPI001159EF17|nr:hypothetical protein [Spirosoma sp. KCTC 42546]QDK80810.1 hypothetical protein EXU85_20245 [Spirosoma sp. KCTC 42546]